MKAQANRAGTETACSQQQEAITSDDLPLCCPLPRQASWNAHPRVYLTLDEDTGSATCPYCGTGYQLKS